ncbi:MAG: hypothetical protein Q9Q13_08240 [Acidobacteriota bacterium]|nr:hypothetical protein [Acidobacteriota bacterium]
MAVGKDLRSYSLGTFLSRDILPFGNRITAFASREDSPRLVVATGRRVMAVNTGDPRQRGSLPLRAEITLPGQVVKLALPAGEGPPVALVESPPSVVFLSPGSLAPLESFALDRAAATLIAEEPGKALAVFPEGGVRQLRLRVPWRTLRDRPPSPAQPTRPPTPPEPALPAAPRAAPSPAPTPDALPSPVDPPPAPSAAVPPEIPAVVAPRGPVQPPLDLGRLPGGTVAGALEGKAALVREVVFQGPDDLLRVELRVAPEKIGERFYYRAEKLPEGDYRVVPMGSGGSSLRCRPPFRHCARGTR